MLGWHQSLEYLLEAFRLRVPSPLIHAEMSINVRLTIFRSPSRISRRAKSNRHPNVAEISAVPSQRGRKWEIVPLLEISGTQYVFEDERRCVCLTLQTVRRRCGEAESDEINFVIRNPTPGSWVDLTRVFCTSGSEREFTLEGSWYADEEIQAGTDRDTATAG